MAVPSRLCFVTAVLLLLLDESRGRHNVSARAVSSGKAINKANIAAPVSASSPTNICAVDAVALCCRSKTVDIAALHVINLLCCRTCLHPLAHNIGAVGAVALCSSNAAAAQHWTSQHCTSSTCCAAAPVSTSSPTNILVMEEMAITSRSFSVRPVSSCSTCSSGSSSISSQQESGASDTRVHRTCTCSLATEGLGQKLCCPAKDCQAGNLAATQVLAAAVYVCAAFIKALVSC